MVGQNDEEHFRQIPAEYFDLICNTSISSDDSRSFSDVEIELLNFASYLSASDGVIRKEEAAFLEQRYVNRGENFANGREVRNIFEVIISNQANRLFGRENISNEELCEIIPNDVCI